MDVSENRGFPPESSILIRFSIIFTIHFGVPYFWKHPYISHFDPLLTEAASFIVAFILPDPRDWLLGVEVSVRCVDLGTPGPRSLTWWLENSMSFWEDLFSGTKKKTSEVYVLETNQFPIKIA